MEKILLLINARNPHLGSIDFACQMAALAGTRVTGLFVENVYYGYVPPGGMDNPGYFAAVAEAQAVAVTTDTEQAVRLFKEKCERAKIESQVVIDSGDPMQQVIFESRFADLLILDPMISFYGREEALPSHFIKEILLKSECPVLLAPYQFDQIDELLFCYDGSASSVFAIKQFTYLFPELKEKKVMLLEVKNTSAEAFSEKDKRMMDWLRTHYRSAYYHSLNGDVDEVLFTFLFMKRNIFVVMGAYGRPLISQLFKKSAADVLIRNIDLPLFITHH